MKFVKLFAFTASIICFLAFYEFTKDGYFAGQMIFLCLAIANAWNFITINGKDKK